MKENYIKSLELKNFTAFDEINFEFSPGINVFIGANATGKTHILKVLYSILRAYEDFWKKARDVKSREDRMDLFFLAREKLEDNFLPEGLFVTEEGILGESEEVIKSSGLGRLIRRGEHREPARILMTVNGSLVDYTIVMNTGATSAPGLPYFELEKPPVFIPSKEILSNAPDLLGLFETREIETFEEIYSDIISKAYRRGLVDIENKAFYPILERIVKVTGGKVKRKNNKFYLEDEWGYLEFNLVAEGFSKLGLLWVLINNGSIEPGCTLFWDEPETNLNPSLLRLVVGILLELQRHDVQIFVATHNYVLLKEFDLQMKEMDEVMFHSLYRDEETGSIKRKSTNDYISIHPDVINDTYLDLYVRDMNRDSDRDRNDNG